MMWSLMLPNFSLSSASEKLQAVCVSVWNNCGTVCLYEALLTLKTFMPETDKHMHILVGTETYEHIY